MNTNKNSLTESQLDNIYLINYNDKMNALLFLLCLLCVDFPAIRSRGVRVEQTAAPQEVPSRGKYLRLKIYPQDGHESVSRDELEYIAQYIYQLAGDNEYIQIWGDDDEMEVLLPTPCLVSQGGYSPYADQSEQILASIRQLEHPSDDPAYHLELLPVHSDNEKILHQLWQQHQETGEALALPAELSDYQVMKQRSFNESGTYAENYLIVARPEFMVRQGLLINPLDIMVYPDSMGQQGIFYFHLSHEGAAQLSRITQEMKHGQDRLAIIIGGQLLSSACVQSTLSNGFQLTGQNEEELALLTKAAQGCIAVPNKVVIEEEGEEELKFDDEE
ncbi:MAG: hypothetical protein R3Y56_09735 [Akkermansia sp.]